MKYFPDLPSPQTQVPVVELMPLPGGTKEETTQVSPLQRSRARSKHAEQALSIDIRLPIVNEFLESGGLEANSRRAYQRALRRFITWSVEPFAEISARRLAQYRDWLEETPASGKEKPLARSSVNLEIAAIKVFFGWLQLNYPSHCPTNPAVQLKQRKLNVATPEDITPEALQWVWAALKHNKADPDLLVRDRALLHLLAHGLRASEVEKLNLASFDGEVLFLGQTKTHRSRMVPLSEAGLKVIQQYLNWRTKEFGEGEPEQPLLVSLHAGHRGKRLSYSGIYQSVERIGSKARNLCILDWLAHSQKYLQDPAAVAAAQALCDASELKRWDETSINLLMAEVPYKLRQILEELKSLHPHNFRHTYVVDLLLRGLDPAHARQLSGHQSQQVFSRYAMRVEQKAAIAAFRRLEASSDSAAPDFGYDDDETTS